jgi:hypothetical protein
MELSKKPKKPKEITQYKNIILRKEQYSINDSISILEKNEKIGFGKITNIWQDKSTSKSFATITWYYLPEEVFKKVPDFISEAELFESTNTQDIPIESIIEKVEVLSFSAYHSMDEVESSTYFSRALYKHKSNTVVPLLSTWKRVCYCESILNPDLIYNKCDGCSSYFHFECCDFKSSSEDSWLCRSCITN